MEFVFVAPREALFATCYPQGFQRFRTEREGESFLARVGGQGFFVQRERAEETPGWKQIIPYCVVASDERILLMKRRAKGGEARLHDKFSIGVGGHINPLDNDDAGAIDLVRSAARREIAEELEVRGEYDLHLVGYLNDDSNPVGAVHLGVVFAANPSGSVRIREQDVLEGAMVDRAELRARLARGENLETWSSILIAHLDELLPVRQSATH
jgi:predicted NUDIX family phosphoesterase